MSGPPRELARARASVAAALADAAAAHPDGLVLVACSGGADSLALAVAAAYAAPRIGLRVGAIVVDHGLQQGSRAVAEEAAAACRGLGLEPVEVRTVVVPTGPGSGGPEGAARAARYAALDAAATQLGACAILLGHTADDQAETVLLGLARGSGARSLSGMRPQLGLLRRPLLGLRRRDTESICAAAGLAWWTDPTNLATQPDAPLRSRLRTLAMPVLADVLGDIVPALARTAEQLAEDDEALADLAESLLTESLHTESHVSEAGGALPIILRIAPLVAAPAAIRRRALRRAALAAGCPGGALNRSHVLGLDGLLTDWHGQGPLHLPGAVGARRDCGSLVLEHLDN